jgi:uncharacterized membrane protein
LAAALYVVIIAPIAVFRPRRYIAHKILGFIWVLAMGLLAGSSFAITENGRFSLIHLLSCLVLVSLVRGLRSIRQRLIVAHARHMRALYLQALLGAGGGTFLPDHSTSRLLFSQNPWLGFACMMGVCTVVILLWRRQAKRLA